MKKIIIIGAGGHGKVVADIAKKNGYQEILFLDDNKKGYCGVYRIVGKVEMLSEFSEYDVFVAIGDSYIRSMLHKKNDNLVSLIHPNAVVADDVVVGKGVVIMAGAVINSASIIGDGCIINTSSSVDHDCNLGEFVHVAVGSHIAGNVHIGGNTWVGGGAFINNNIDICCDCMIGSGAVVVKDLIEAGVYVGVPAKKIKCK